MTLTLEERANMMCKQRRSSQPFVFLFSEAASWLDDAEGWRYNPFPLIPPSKRLHVPVCYITSHQEQGQSVRVLPEGCISVCWTGSLWSGVGMAGPEMAGCPLLSVLPLKQGHFSFLKSKSFYKLRDEYLKAKERETPESSRQELIFPGRTSSVVGVGPVWEFLISRCCSSKCATRQRGSFFYVVAQQSIKKLIHLILNCFVSIVWNRFM